MYPIDDLLIREPFDRRDAMVRLFRRQVDEFAELARQSPRDWERLVNAAREVSNESSRINMSISNAGSSERQRGEFARALRDFVRESTDLLADVSVEIPVELRLKLAAKNKQCAERLSFVETMEERIRQNAAAMDRILRAGHH